MGTLQFANGMKVDNIKCATLYSDCVLVLLDDDRNIRMITLYGGYFACGRDFKCKKLETIGTVLLEAGSRCKCLQSEVAYISRIKKDVEYNCGIFVSSNYHGQVVDTIKQSLCYGSKIVLSGDFVRVAINSDEGSVSQDAPVCLIESGASVESIQSKLACCSGSVGSLACVTCYVKG